MASIIGKARAVKEWAQSWVNSPIVKMNATTIEDGEFALNVDATDEVIEQYLDGTARREYMFALVCVLPWSADVDDTNETAQQFAESWHDWVTEQNAKRAFPDFGSGASISALKCIQNTPTPALVYSDKGLAKYQFFAKIEYTE